MKQRFGLKNDCAALIATLATGILPQPARPEWKHWNFGMVNFDRTGTAIALLKTGCSRFGGDNDDVLSAD